jgi:radical SAM superfamily enzyme YgiQ (UPF0313 family)
MNILAINPWIHDFAAYDFWLKPYGLLSLVAELRSRGFKVSYIDALDRFRPDEAGPRQKKFGTGKFQRRPVERPEALAEIPRPYCRYGISEAALRQDLAAVSGPDLILVTCLMTYWYTGAQATISLLKEVFPGVPVVLGGIYAALCPGHARRESGADLVISGADLKPLADFMSAGPPQDLEFPLRADPLKFTPAWDLARRRPYICLMTSLGCPFRCSYCASGLLYSGFERRDPGEVAAEIAFWADKGVEDFAFYDDALLYKAERHIVPILEDVVRRRLKVRFHSPNGLHLRYLDEPLCRLMRRAGFVTLRFGLETVDPHRQEATGGKVNEDILLRGSEILRRAGFDRSTTGCYLLAGMPGQRWQEVAEGIELVKSLNMRPYIAEYSPIPGTALWGEAIKSSPFDILNEPLWHNNTLLSCRWSGFTLDDLQRLKAMARS